MKGLTRITIEALCEEYKRGVRKEFRAFHKLMLEKSHDLTAEEEKQLQNTFGGEIVQLSCSLENAVNEVLDIAAEQQWDSVESSGD